MSLAQRAPIRAVFAVLLAAAFTALSVGPAHAAAYRFWGFYQLTDGQWAFAQKGSDQIVPKDGSVDGWRFAGHHDSLGEPPDAELRVNDRRARCSELDSVPFIGSPARMREPQLIDPRSEILDAIPPGVVGRGRPGVLDQRLAGGLNGDSGHWCTRRVAH